MTSFWQLRQRNFDLHSLTQDDVSHPKTSNTGMFHSSADQSRNDVLLKHLQSHPNEFSQMMERDLYVDNIISSFDK